MANRAVSLGSGVAAGLAIWLAAGLAPLLWHADFSALHPADITALRFTLLQALLSAAAACLVAVPLARALFRRRFWGRGALVKLLSAPFILPTFAAVMGLMAVAGREGWVNAALGSIGVQPVSIFGLGGVVLAHVFLNLPLALRMVLQGWSSMPAERFVLAQSLRFSPRAAFLHLELPMLIRALPSAFAAIFLICLTSFSVALILGGGPRASTIELGIYQSLRFQFDLGRAANLALMQVAVSLAAALISAALWRPMGFGVGLDRALPPIPTSRLAAAVDSVFILGAALFIAVPLVALVARGHSVLPPTGLVKAASLSVFVALLAAALAVLGALPMALARAKGAGAWVELAAMLPLGTSSLAMGTGLFLALRPLAQPQALALPLAVLVNASLALPFMFRLLLPACRDIEQGYARLIAQVNLSPWAALRLVVLPRLAPALGFAAGLAAAMAMGDFGVLALFGGVEQATLPILIARLMGAYRMEAAAAATLWFVALSFAMFWIFDHLGGRDAGA